MKQIPNLFTLLNLILGAVAIIFILQPGESIMNYNGEEWKVYLPERIQWGAICIFLAAVVDFRMVLLPGYSKLIQLWENNWILLRM
jgi:CDP-diacylglycerol--serine O-phosphatidyltransferase